jgi:hypothetical protein
VRRGVSAEKPHGRALTVHEQIPWGIVALAAGVALALVAAPG